MTSTSFPRSVRKSSTSGFTLVELLVVVGIIGLLLGIVLPTVNRARIQARLIQDVANIRTFGQACIVYATEHDGVLPMGTRDSAAVHVDDIIWIRRSTWSLLHTKYGVPKEALSCNGHWDQDTFQEKIGVDFGEGMGSFLGWVYFGNRPGHQPVQYPSLKPYIFPMRITDTNATSRVLATCFSYVPRHAWTGYLPHQKGTDAMLTVLPMDDPSGVSAAGLSIVCLARKT